MCNYCKAPQKRVFPAGAIKRKESTFPSEEQSGTVQPEGVRRPIVTLETELLTEICVYVPLWVLEQRQRRWQSVVNTLFIVERNMRPARRLEDASKIIGGRTRRPSAGKTLWSPLSTLRPQLSLNFHSHSSAAQLSISQFRNIVFPVVNDYSTLLYIIRNRYEIYENSRVDREGKHNYFSYKNVW